MTDADQIERYIYYPQYTYVNGVILFFKVQFEVLWPLEISEEILQVIMDRVVKHFQDRKEINSEVRLFY